MTAPVPYLQQDPRNLSPSQRVPTEKKRLDPDPIDPRLRWQVQDQRRKDEQQGYSDKLQVSPVASTINTDQFKERLPTISRIGESATAGAIASANTRRQQEEAARLKRFQEQQQAAMMAAYNGMQNVPVGQPGSQQQGGGGEGWGQGGAQGVANVLRAAGFPEELVPTFMAIAKAESGWRPDALNTSNRNGSTDAGLFQINSVHRGNAWYPSNLNDPLQSAKAAWAIYQQQGLRAWSVYNNGAYKQFLGAAPPKQVTAVPSTTGGMVTTGNGTLRNQVVQASLQVLNLPYVWGGNSMRTGVDCSGLVQQVYQQVGIQMPRQARAQATTGTRVGSVNQLRPGDLVAFQWAGGYAGANTVSHIAVYAGNNEIIEAYGGSNGRRRSLGNSTQDRGAIYISTRFPGE